MSVAAAKTARKALETGLRAGTARTGYPGLLPERQLTSLPVSDLAVVGLDPAFGGGGAAQLEAFLAAATALGRSPELHHGRMSSRFRPFDAINQVTFGRKVAASLRGARDVWVVATSASSGYGAALSGRPYSAWIGTGHREEWAGRRQGLRPSRRLAIRVNAPMLRRLERRVLAGARRVYATSPASRAMVARAGGLDEDAVGILPLPIDVDRFGPAPDAAWEATLGDPVIVFVGRAADSRKNVRLLLEAARLLPEIRLLLVGEPPAPPLPDRVEATGPVASVVPFLHRGTLFVLPSHQEGFGIAAAEAMAAGLPVVTTPSGGPEALVRDSGGGVVLSGFSPEELAATVRDLLADPARLAEMRRRGREHVAREHSPARLRTLLAEALA
jgi:glycosyltransferase involved in cell wall biosynthesis